MTIRYTYLRSGAAAVVAALLAACGGGSSSGGSSALPHGSGAVPAQVALTMKMSSAPPVVAKSGHRMHPQRVSSATAGVSATVYFHSDTHHTTAVGTAAFDVSSSSSICTAQGGARSCALQFPAPVPPSGDSDDVVISTFDAVPAGGSIPPTANMLDTGQFTIAVTPGAHLTPTVTLGGIPAGATLAIDNPQSSFDANLYGGISYNVELQATDASGATIIGADQFSSPVVLSITGSSAATIRINGATSSQVNAPSDVITLVDSSASGVTPTLHAVAGSSNASVGYSVEARGQLSTSFAAGTAPKWIVAGADGNLYASDGLAELLKIDSVGHTTTALALPGGNFIIDLAAAANGSTSLNLAVASHGVSALTYDTTLQSFGSLQSVMANGGVVCSFANASDGRAYMPCSTQIADFATLSRKNVYSSPVAFDGVAAGPDGALWLADRGNGSIDTVAPSAIGGGATTIQSFAGPAGSLPYRITPGPDGALWFSDQGTNSIGRISTGGTIAEFAIPDGGTPYGIAAGPDGGLWFTARGGSNGSYIGRVDTSGAFTSYQTSLSLPTGITVGPDNALWFVDAGSNTVGRLIP